MAKERLFRKISAFIILFIIIILALINKAQETKKANEHGYESIDDYYAYEEINNELNKMKNIYIYGDNNIDNEKLTTILEENGYTVNYKTNSNYSFMGMDYPLNNRIIIINGGNANDYILNEMIKINPENLSEEELNTMQLMRIAGLTITAEPNVLYILHSDIKIENKEFENEGLKLNNYNEYITEFRKTLDTINSNYIEPIKSRSLIYTDTLSSFTDDEIITIGNEILNFANNVISEKEQELIEKYESSKEN